MIREFGKQLCKTTYIYYIVFGMVMLHRYTVYTVIKVLTVIKLLAV